MIERITTPNMLEIAYLLERHHQVVAVDTATGWPYGIKELAVTLEGNDIGIDHANFLRHGIIDFAQVFIAFTVIQAVIEQKLEETSAPISQRGIQ